MTTQQPTGCVIAAPHSGAGKTLVTLGLLRALRRQGYAISGAKVGPDYIDPGFHYRASGNACLSLDLWAMGSARMRHLVAQQDGLLIVEGVMGLFDGADDGSGTSADVAVALDLPVILVVDARAQAGSAAALLHGFKTWRHDVRLQGVIFNRVGSARHAALLASAAEKAGVAMLGALPHDEQLVMPSRHLGLVPAEEYPQIETLIERAADWISGACDLDHLVGLCTVLAPSDETEKAILPPLGQRIALAHDAAFGFTYHHIIDGWHKAGAEICPFSPLSDEAPDQAADAVFLPGGYPELHAGRLAANSHFLAGLRACAAQDTLIYGECGGFMVMGERLVDQDGTSHGMAGLLPVATSFQKRVRHLGYRRLRHESPLPWPRALRGHEFHYSTLIEQASIAPLFTAKHTTSDEVEAMGLCQGRLMGSYAHIISPDWTEPS